MKIITQTKINYEEFLKKDFFQELSMEKKENLISIINSVQCYEIWYNSDGRKIKGYIVTPKDSTKKLPVLIYARGGSKNFGIINDRVITFPLSRIASWGFIVITTQYSGNDGSEGKDELSGMDLKDLINLKEVIKEIPNADINNINIYGASRGGLMALNLLKSQDWIKKAIIINPELDLEDSYEKRPELKEFRKDMYDVESKSENLKRSPFYNFSKINKNTKILLIQGGLDINVNPLKTIAFYHSLINNDFKNIEFHYFPYVDHHLNGISKRLQDLIIKEFLEK